MRKRAYQFLLLMGVLTLATPASASRLYPSASRLHPDSSDLRAGGVISGTTTLADDVELEFGTDGDADIKWDSAAAKWDFDVGATTVWAVDASTVTQSIPLHFGSLASALCFDTDNNSCISAATNNFLDVSPGGSGAYRFTNSDMRFNKSMMLGTNGAAPDAGYELHIIDASAPFVHIENTDTTVTAAQELFKLDVEQADADGTAGISGELRLDSVGTNGEGQWVLSAGLPGALVDSLTIADGAITSAVSHSFTLGFTAANNTSNYIGGGTGARFYGSASFDQFLLDLSGAEAGMQMVIAGAGIDDYGHDAETDPALYVQSADDGSTADYVKIQHNQTDGLISSGAGNLNLDAAGGAVTLADGVHHVLGDESRLVFNGSADSDTYFVQSATGGDDIAFFRAGSSQWSTSSSAVMVVSGTGARARISNGQASSTVPVFVFTNESNGGLGKNNGPVLIDGGAAVAEFESTAITGGASVDQVWTADNGAKITRTYANEVLTFAGDPGDATKTTSGLIPSGAKNVTITSRVTTTGTNCTSVNIGDGSDADLFGATIAVASGTTSTTADYTAQSPWEPAVGGGEVTVTGVGGNCFDLVIRIEAVYETSTGPTG